jgi:hypothetical protein
MRFDRRDFIRIGAAGALGALGQVGRADGLSRRTVPAPALLRMQFKGLCLLERQKNAMVVHLIDSATVGLGPHIMEMRVPENAIDLASTKAKPDALETIGDTTFLKWRLNKRKVSGPPASSETGDLTVQEDVPPNQQKPTPANDNDEGWKSLHWVPDLRSICGATKLLKPASATIALNHGEFSSRRPDGSGPHAVWKFTRPDGTEVLRRALTNRVLYLCPSSTPLTISVDSEPLVLRAGTTEIIDVVNLPEKPPAPSSKKLNMDHFTKFYDLVDAKSTPKPELLEFSPPVEHLVEPDYCPPGRI